MRNSFKLVEEYIQNDDSELTNTKFTTINLSKGGDNFFIGHIENRERYCGLADIHTPFTARTVGKVRQLGFDGMS